MTDSCAGACCAAFPLAINHPAFNKGAKGEAAFIADMVIPLTRRQALARSRKFGYPDPPKYPSNWSWFTCRHWDEETRLCGVYDKRPAMCQDYPYFNNKCERGCGYKLGQSDHAKAAERDDSPWLWDAEAAGWRPRSTSKMVWDARRRLMTRKGSEQAVKA